MKRNACVLALMLAPLLAGSAAAQMVIDKKVISADAARKIAEDMPARGFRIGSGIDAVFKK